MSIKLLAVDIDHTLLDHDRKIHPANVPAVRKAVDAGIIVVLASGRFRPTMLPFMHQLGLSGPMIAANGTATYAADGALIDAHFVSPTVYDQVVAYARVHEAHLNVYTESELLFVNSGPWGEIYLQRVHSVPPKFRPAEEVRGENILKLLIADDPARIHTFRRDLEATLPPEEVCVTESEPEYLEFLAYGCSKGKALQALCGSLDVDQSEVAAIGDFLNDVEMVDWASLGGAVGNAHEAVKRVAQVVVASNDDGGVAEFIERYVLAAA